MINTWYQKHSDELWTGIVLTGVNALVWALVGAHMDTTSAALLGFATNVIALGISRWHFSKLNAGETVKARHVVAQIAVLAVTVLAVFGGWVHLNYVKLDDAIAYGLTTFFGLAFLNVMRALHLRENAENMRPQKRHA